MFINILWSTKLLLPVVQVYGGAAGLLVAVAQRTPRHADVLARAALLHAGLVQLAGFTDCCVQTRVCCRLNQGYGD